MRKVKKLLYSIALTSFIAICSINVFAEGGDNGIATGAQAGRDCINVMKQVSTETVTTNKQVTNDVVHEVDEDFSGGATLNPGNPMMKIILSKMIGTWQ